MRMLEFYVLIMVRKNFSEYLMEELKQQKKYPSDPITGRCMCIGCGGRKNINNRYADTISINKIAERTEKNDSERNINDDDDDATKKQDDDIILPSKKKQRRVGTSKSKSIRKSNKSMLKQPPPSSITPSKVPTTTPEQACARLWSAAPSMMVSNQLNPLLSMHPPMQSYPPAFVSLPFPLLPFYPTEKQNVLPTTSRCMCRCFSNRPSGFCCDVNYQHKTSNNRKTGRPPQLLPSFFVFVFAVFVVVVVYV